MPALIAQVFSQATIATAVPAGSSATVARASASVSSPGASPRIATRSGMPSPSRSVTSANVTSPSASLATRTMSRTRTVPAWTSSTSASAKVPSSSAVGRPTTSTSTGPTGRTCVVVMGPSWGSAAVSPLWCERAPPPTRGPHTCRMIRSGRGGSATPYRYGRRLNHSRLGAVGVGGPGGRTRPTPRESSCILPEAHGGASPASRSSPSPASHSSRRAAPVWHTSAADPVTWRSARSTSSRTSPPSVRPWSTPIWSTPGGWHSDRPHPCGRRTTAPTRRRCTPRRRAAPPPRRSRRYG